MTTNQLCLVALLGAPFLCIGVYVEAYYAPLGNSWWTGVWGLLYITGWIASMEAMRRLNLAGTDRFGRSIVWVVLATLLIANVSNVWQAVAPTYKPVLFVALDMGWPVSNVLMLAVGVAVLRANRLRGWQRWVPLAVGLWLPLTMAVSQTPIVLHVSNLYSAVAWSLLAVVLLRETARPVKNRVSIQEASTSGLATSCSRKTEGEPYSV